MTKPSRSTDQDLRDPARQDLEHRPKAVDKRTRKDEIEHGKATQFDGNPNVQNAPDGPLGPKDDTPWKIEKKDG